MTPPMYLAVHGGGNWASSLFIQCWLAYLIGSEEEIQLPRLGVHRKAANEEGANLEKEGRHMEHMRQNGH